MRSASQVAELEAACALYLLNSPIQSHISVLLVHVVVASTRLIPHPYTEVLDGCGVFLGDLHSGMP